MAFKRTANSKGEIFITDTAQKISQAFDKKYDVRNTFTFRIMSNIQGEGEEAVRAAVLLAMKKAGAKSANIKVRFTMPYAEEHLDDLTEIAKTIQLENEARIQQVRESLSDEEKKMGRVIAYQNYAHMLIKDILPSTVSDTNIQTAMKNTGTWYTPEGAVFNLKLDFVGLTDYNAGLDLEKQITVTNSEGKVSTAFRAITEVGGMKSCPVTINNKNEMADMLYSIITTYDKTFKDIDGANMDQLLNSLKKFTNEYRQHDNETLIDTKLSEEEKAQAQEWCLKAIDWMSNM